jgi:hypothetical protein
MMIPVIYPNGRHDMVKDFLLNKMIIEQQITRFKRSDGWIDINSSRLRGKGRKLYAGPERRQQEEITAELADIF